jgi:hypothetical protein
VRRVLSTCFLSDSTRIAARLQRDDVESLLTWGIRTPRSPPSPLCAHRGRFLGKLLRAISRFRHQDAQTPPSPLCGSRGKGGMRGHRCIRMPKLSLLPLWEKGEGG